MFEIKPKTRKEIYMAYLAGDMSLELPEPLTRDEVTLYNLCQSHAYGSTTTVKEVLAECQPPMTSPDDGMFGLVTDATFVAGETYLINWNGVEYPCVAQDMSAMMPDAIGLGNLSAFGGSGNGEPFNIAVMSGQMAITALDGSTTLTISIRQEVTEVLKISGKYVEGMGYVEKSVKETFPVQEITFDDEGGCSLEADFEKPEIGQECIVTLDGVEYTCVAWDCVVAAAVGNGALAGFETETDYPFFLEFSRCVIVAPEFAGKTVSFGIKIVSETIHPIDQKFLPSGGGGGAVIFTMTETGYTCNVTYAEADEMLRNGASAFVKMFRNTLEAAMGGQRLTADTIQWHTDDAGAYMMINFGTTLGLVYKEDNTITEAT